MEDNNQNKKPVVVSIKLRAESGRIMQSLPAIGCMVKTAGGSLTVIRGEEEGVFLFLIYELDTDMVKKVLKVVQGYLNERGIKSSIDGLKQIGEGLMIQVFYKVEGKDPISDQMFETGWITWSEAKECYERLQHYFYQNITVRRLVNGAKEEQPRN